MATFTKTRLSGGTDGRSILVTATATAGTLIHTAHATANDEIWLYATNTDSTDKKLTIEFGGTTSPNDLIEQTITTEGGLILIVPGLLVTNSVVVRAFAETGSVITINGFVNRIA